MIPTDDPTSPAASAPLMASAVVVVNYGSHALLEQNLVSVSDAAPEAMIVVVDNFTTPDEQDHVRALCESRGWTAVLLDTNLGFGAGVNAGAASAFSSGRTVLVVLNPDATIERGSLVRLSAAAFADPDVMVAPVIRRSDGTVWFHGSDLYLDDGRMGSPRKRGEREGQYREWLTGACFALSDRLWRRVEGFDDDYFLYWEDVDLSVRVTAAGGRLVIDEAAEAIHDEGGTHTERRSARAKSETYYYYNIRNRLVYAAKHATDRELKQWLGATVRVSYEILLQGGREQFLKSPAPLRAFVRGIRDGRRFVRENRTF